MHGSKNIFLSITATPIVGDGSYAEILPCDELLPYIRCFWRQDVMAEGEPLLHEQRASLIIPDACMDIVLGFDDDSNLVSSVFCTLDEDAHVSNPDTAAGARSLFGIRFYGWTAGLFAKENINGIRNRTLEASEFFPYILKDFVPKLAGVASFSRKAEIANRYFLKRLDEAIVNYDLMNAAAKILEMKGNVRTSEIARSVAMSEKQMERKYREKIGVSPKSLSSLIRYQLLWQDLFRSPECDIQDLVDKYGYFDQAHLLNDFKRRHKMTVNQAVRFAASKNNVGFFQ
jgi:AraC-like DNA-binding protein